MTIIFFLLGFDASIPGASILDFMPDSSPQRDTLPVIHIDMSNQVFTDSEGDFGDSQFGPGKPTLD